MTGKHGSIEQRFWEKVCCYPGECWEWLGGRHPAGYGRINVDGKNKAAHRVSWEINQGPIPIGLCVLHKCDNPGCVNPDHLWVDTQAANNKDMFAKGRNNSGHGGPPHKFTDVQVEQIKTIYSAGGTTQKELAKIYNVSRGTMLRVINNIGCYKKEEESE